MIMAMTKRQKERLREKWIGSSLANRLYEELADKVEVTKKGTAKLPTAVVKAAIEQVLTEAALTAAKGNRVRLPVIGALVRKDVKARQSGKGVNPFTGEPMIIKARPATKKPRWSFPKSLKEIFSKKANW